MCCFPSIWCYLVLSTWLFWLLFCIVWVCICVYILPTLRSALCESDHFLSGATLNSEWYFWLWPSDFYAMVSATFPRARARKPSVLVVLSALKTRGLWFGVCLLVCFLGWVGLVWFFLFAPMIRLGLGNRKWEPSVRTFVYYAAGVMWGLAPTKSSDLRFHK